MRLAQYDPIRDDSEFVTESAHDYIERMRASGNFVRWPDDVIEQWPYRHADFFDKYQFLGFENFAFTREVWRLDQIPGREAFDSPTFLDGFKDVERRAAKTSIEDWLARYMVKHGTWNVPIILLKNDSGYCHPSGDDLRTPYHLLEGHRRLAFLNGLRESGKANAQHEVWIVEIVGT